MEGYFQKYRGKHAGDVSPGGASTARTEHHLSEKKNGRTKSVSAFSTHTPRRNEITSS